MRAARVSKRRPSLRACERLGPAIADFECEPRASASDAHRFVVQATRPSDSGFRMRAARVSKRRPSLRGAGDSARRFRVSNASRDREGATPITSWCRRLGPAIAGFECEPRASASEAHRFVVRATWPADSGFRMRAATVRERRPSFRGAGDSARRFRVSNASRAREQATPNVRRHFSGLRIRTCGRRRIHLPRPCKLDLIPPVSSRKTGA